MRKSSDFCRDCDAPKASVAYASALCLDPNKATRRGFHVLRFSKCLGLSGGRPLASIAAVILIVTVPEAVWADATVAKAAINDSATSIQLPAGNIYLYGMATGGAAPSSAFGAGQYAQAVDAAGQIAASLAYGTTSQNSYTTSTAFHVIGGVSISGSWDSFTTFNGLNTSPGASSTSVNFTVTERSLVVFIGLASSQQSISVTGIPGVQVDALASGEGMVIAHAYLMPGAYTAMEQSAALSAGQDPEHMADLLGVFVFGSKSSAASTMGGPTSGQNPLGGDTITGQPPLLPDVTVPVYAFHGAYVGYDLRSGNKAIPFMESISDISAGDQTYRYSIALGGVSHILRAEIARIGERFPALSRKELNSLRRGVAPQDFPGQILSFTHSVTLSVPAGRFMTEQVALRNGVLWFDSTSGVLVKATGRDLVASIFGDARDLLDDPSTTASLTKTNVQMTAARSSNVTRLVYGAAGGVAVVLIGLVVFSVVRRRRPSVACPAPVSGSAGYVQPSASPRTDAATRQMVGPSSYQTIAGAGAGAARPAPPTAPLTLEALDRLAKLKALVDQGDITREQFEREKAKLLGSM